MKFLTLLMFLYHETSFKNLYILFLAVRQVCTSWRTAAVKETYNAKSKAPWLVIYTLSTPGRILLSKRYSEYRIVNPFSSVSIELPALKELHPELRLIYVIALSSSPSLSRSYSVMIFYGPSPGLAFLRSREDAWTAANRARSRRRCTVLELTYYNGLFVALDEQSQIMTFNERKCPMESRLFLGTNRYVDGDPYLVECSGSLLVAWKIWRKKYDGPVKEIRVFKVDSEKGTKEEVESLNVSLFLNGGSSFSVEFNAKSCLPGIKPNRVYCHDGKEDKIKSYSVEDRKFETYVDATSSCLFDATSNCPSDATRRRVFDTDWFQPDF
ncbi:hypothetical protein ACJRO7_020934 [Eucalyptus globulus]|uniref:KIB1-4 beta-propeller domain-containing protein n=1 Tax=Eucalyptus globulus TaxID=34317 RepID=A0ABD3KR01_EUCGL